MQPEQRPAPSIRRPTRLIKYSYPSTIETDFIAPASDSASDLTDAASQPTTRIKRVNNLSLPVTPPFSFKSIAGADPDDVSSQSTHLMHLSGMMRTIRVPKQQS